MVCMATRPPRTTRRTDALSKRRTVDAAIEILDADGERALTFRALASRLETGSGAIYWHVENKGDLLAAASDDVIACVLAGSEDSAEPFTAIHAVALGCSTRSTPIRGWAPSSSGCRGGRRCCGSTSVSARSCGYSASPSGRCSMPRPRW